jgi:ABC-2 type transport system ATP-binding protein
MPSHLALRAAGLVKSFRAVRAVDGLDLVIAPTERVALLGPNGAGKTTTLLMCLGVIEPDAGSVEILGRSLPRHRGEAMLEVGFAAGYLPLPERMRVREYLQMFARFQGLRDPVAATRRGLARFGAVQRAEDPGRHR